MDQEHWAAPATGALIQRVVDGSTAEKAGLRRGDVIVRYGEQAIATHAELVAAIAAQPPGEVTLVVARDGSVATITASAGKLGVHLRTVVAGEKLIDLPPATVKQLDPARLKAPFSGWFDFIIDGRKVGAEFVRVSLADGRLTVHNEVLFDGGEQWGLNHMIETDELALDRLPHALSLRHEGPLWGFLATGSADPARERWTLVQESRDEQGQPVREEHSAPLPASAVPDYALGSLALLLPREVGACLHARTMTSAAAEPEPRCALVCVGEEEIDVAGERVRAWRYDRRRSPTRISAVTWIAGDAVVKSDFTGGSGGTIAVRSTRERATAGLHPQLVPRAK